MKPSVGSPVQFWPGALIPSLAGKGPFAALVIAVHDETNIEVVFFTNGATNFATAKLFWNHGERPNKDVPFCEPVQGVIT